MAYIDDLIGQISDPELRTRIDQEYHKVVKNKKFGLVFEEHLPECTPLYDVPLRKGSLVAKKDEHIDEIYTVINIEGDSATCIERVSKETVVLPVNTLVSIAQFGDPIYPYLKPIDSVCNAPDDKLWHTLIEADNYHALQLLEYLYAGKVDCIYIDPPYNTGARDWKYNNDYVDSSDSYRHSKWLSFMKRRLEIAKKLLNPKDSVLIVTIDEKEYLHLGCLLEEMFPEANMQMVSSCINVGGVSRKNQFYRTDEYLYFVQFGDSAPAKLPLSMDWLGNVKNTTKNKLRWRELRRSGTHDTRADAKNEFYPIFVTKDGKSIHSVGDSYFGNDITEVVPPEKCVAIWPLFPDGREGCWRLSQSSVKKCLEKGYIKLGRFTSTGMAISYIADGEQKKVESGDIPIVGRAPDGSIIVNTDNYEAKFIPGSQWNITSHDATRYGTKMISEIFTDKRFSFPKSLYAEHDAIRFFVENKPNALILDFFAGSGTTLHAVNLLNAEDGGHRRCIIVTNNEVSDAEAKELTSKGYQPGDEEWEKLGIARYVTWPRTVCSIEGHDVNGNPLKGNYISDKELPMADGFKANCAYFKLGFLDKNEVSLGLQFENLLSLLWMKAGANGPCPSLDNHKIPDYLVLNENKMAVLTNESKFAEFQQELTAEIETVFIVTDSESAYKQMISQLNVKDTYQLYRDYLDNFRINTGR